MPKWVLAAAILAGTSPSEGFFFSPNLLVSRSKCTRGCQAPRMNAQVEGALKQVASEGNLQGLKSIMEMGVEADYRGVNGGTPLFWSAVQGQPILCKYLLEERKANPALQNNLGHTPLHAAAIYGHADVAEQLLSCGAPLDLLDAKGSTALLVAAANGHTELVELLHKKGDSLSAGNWDGMTPAMVASQAGHKDCLKYLAANGADLDAVNTDGNSALALSLGLSKNELEVFQFLVTQGQCSTDMPAQAAPLLQASVKLHAAAVQGDTAGVAAQLQAVETEDAAENEARLKLFGKAALYCGARFGHLGVVEQGLALLPSWELGSEDGVKPLVMVCGEGHLQVLQHLLQVGGTPDTPDKQAGFKVLLQTLTLVAAQGGHTEVVQLLQQVCPDLDLNWVNEAGVSCLIAATKNGHLDVVNYLLGSGVDIGQTDAEGWTSLMGAAARGHVEVVDALLAAGADAKPKQKAGETALHLAAENGHDGVVASLIKTDSNINAPNRRGAVPVKLSCNTGSFAAAKLLVAAGAKLDMQGAAGYTPLHAAAAGGHTDLIELLLQAGADPAMLNWDGQTPQELATTKGFDLAAKLLGTD